MSMDLQLTGIRALVTGSSAGLGEAIATMLAEEGASVMVHGRNRERADAVAEAIRTRAAMRMSRWATWPPTLAPARMRWPPPRWPATWLAPA